MKIQHPLWHVITLVLVWLMVVSCILPLGGKPTATPALPSPHSTPGSSGTGKSGDPGGGGDPAGNGGPGSNGGSLDQPATQAPTPIPTPVSGAPYVVKQIQTLGDETVSGEVCDPARPFVVTSTTPRISFKMNFVPQTPGGGNLTYAYSFPSLGETHDARGNYTLKPTGSGGTLLLSMTVSDHVVFNGFNGNKAISYTFDLVPSQNTVCPKNP